MNYYTISVKTIISSDISEGPAMNILKDVEEIFTITNDFSETAIKRIVNCTLLTYKMYNVYVRILCFYDRLWS